MVLAAGLDAGQYLVVVLEGGTPIHTEVLKVVGETRAKIDLRSNR